MSIVFNFEGEEYYVGLLDVILDLRARVKHMEEVDMTREEWENEKEEREYREWEEYMGEDL